MTDTKDQSRMVTDGAHVRDRLCSEVHTLRRPDHAASDALLVYECSARVLDTRGGVPLVNIHVGAILGRLVHGLSPAE
jgi:hypothetical protein